MVQILKQFGKINVTTLRYLNMRIMTVNIWIRKQRKWGAKTGNPFDNRLKMASLMLA